MEVCIYYDPFELYHYGVKGQKWGVRRYQKRDGSLTKLGKKRIDEGASLFPTYKGKHLGYKDKRNAERVAVIEKISADRSKAISREYKKYVKDHPEFDAKQYDAFQIWYGNNRDSKKVEAQTKRYRERFIKEFGQATLKDLNIEQTKKAKEYVENVIKAERVYAGITG